MQRLLQTPFLNRRFRNEYVLISHGARRTRSKQVFTFDQARFPELKAIPRVFLKGTPGYEAAASKRKSGPIGIGSTS